MRCQPVSQARRASQSSRSGSGPSPGNTSPSHSRSSVRNCCSAAVYLRSIGPGAYLTRRQTLPARWPLGSVAALVLERHAELRPVGLDAALVEGHVELLHLGDAEITER